MKISYNKQVLLGALAGLVLGVLLNRFGADYTIAGPVLTACHIIGKIFINLLKMILIPLVFTSITIGIANLRQHAQMGRVWKISLLYFVSTTALAVLLGIVVVNVFQPGADMETGVFQQGAANLGVTSMTMGAFVASFVSGLFMNPVTAMAEGNILPTIIFAIFLGIALVVTGERSRNVLDFFNELFALIMLMVKWIMVVLPIGLMALLASLIASQDLNILLSLGKFMLVVIGATLFHGFVTLPIVLMIFGKIHPNTFFAGIGDALVTAFSTSSSSATLPVTMRCVEDNLKVDKDVAGFVLPLGATINMDGTALYEAVAALFVANLVGVELTLGQQVVVFFTAIVAAIGAPGIPSAGMVTMIMVLQSVGLPIEAISILLPIDRLLDATRTMVNVEGDAIGSCVVNRFTSNKS